MNLTRPLFPTYRIPAPPIPRWFSRGLLHVGGRNVHGDPNYRVIWAMDAVMFQNGDSQARKYPNPNDVTLGYACFWVERWASPAFFNEDNWNALRFGKDSADTGKTIDYLGPFPHRGDYIGVAPLIKDDDEGNPYEMLPLSQQLLEVLQQKLAPGSQKIVNMGVLEAQNRLKKAKGAARVDALLEERKEHYRTHAQEINRRAKRKYVGLEEFKVDPAAHERTSTLGATRQYKDESGAVHTLWADKHGNGNAQIDFTLP